MLTISEETWQQLLAEAQTAIDRLNERCIGQYARYQHRLEIDTSIPAFVIAKAVQITTSEWG